MNKPDLWRECVFGKKNHLTCVDQTLSVEVARPKDMDGQVETVVTIRVQQTYVFADPVKKEPAKLDGNRLAKEAVSQD
jgi:hypothetical protein